MNNTGLQKVLTLALAAGVLACQTASGFAQTYKISSIEGGSSALLGDFRSGSNFRSGAIPSAIGAVPNGIANYKNPQTSDRFFVAAGVVATDGTNVNENIGDAMVRWNEIADGDIRIIVLLRSDSGYGVRYAANRMYVKSWGTFANSDGSAVTDPRALGVIKYLTDNANNAAVESIDTGFSDVSADTIARYAQGFPINPNDPNSPIFTLNADGLQTGISSIPVGVQTLLLLYNKDGGRLDFTRARAAGLINFDASVFVPPYDFDAVFNREPFSGTRNTELLAIQAITPPSVVTQQSGLLGLDYIPEYGTIAVGTGAMISGVDTTPRSFGYAFVTGGAGNNRPNTTVGTYNGVAPYSFGSALPGNGTTRGYDSDPYYDNVLSGGYTLWAYARAVAVLDASGNVNATAQSIFDALNANPSVLHLQGLLSVAELNAAGVDRDYFVSDIVPGEKVYDGQNVVTGGIGGTEYPFPGNPIQ